MILDRLQKRLQDWSAADLYRKQLCTPALAKQDKRVFCSNDYLGLASHPALRFALVETSQAYGVGTGASALVSGYTSCHRRAEEAYADFFGFESALLFSTGYMANLGVIQALVGKGDCIYQDRLNHASLIDGARCTGAQLRRYHHLDMSHLETLLERDKGQPQLVVSDAVFSMRGDSAPLAELCALRRKYDFTLLIDDAHGIGVVGDQGRGSLSAAGIEPDEIDIYVCPLGKAMGCMGGMVMGKTSLIAALRQFSRSYIYTTAMPAALAAVAETSLELLKQDATGFEQLRLMISYFKQKIKTTDLNWWPSDTAIQSLLMGSCEKANRLAMHLNKQGFLITSIRAPTVPKGQEQLRFTVNAAHTQEDIDALFSALAQGVCRDE